MVGFPGLAPDAALEELIDEGVFGAILFKRNVADPEQVRGLSRALKARAGRPFIIAVDQEGGRVARLRGAPFTALPTMRELGAKHDEALVERAGKLLAHELRAAGFDWDFAPVLEVDSNPKNPVIGDRAFSDDPEWVGKLGVALARGLEQGGVASCGKHFPGHGDTSQDSHLALPHLPHDLARLEAVELPPFEAYARAGLASLMTAHVIFDAIDPGVPATMSARVLQGLLRQRLGFKGVLVSDDLEMKAIAEHFSIEDATVRGTLAGVDLFLVCHRAEVQRRAIEGLVKAVEAGRVPRERIEQANARLDALAGRFAHPVEEPLATLGTPEHRALAQGLGAGAAGTDPTEASSA